MEKELKKEDADIKSWFYVQKSILFWGRKVLTFFTDPIELDAIPYRADQKEVIYFSDFVPIQLSYLIRITKN